MGTGGETVDAPLHLTVSPALCLSSSLSGIFRELTTHPSLGVFALEIAPKKRAKMCGPKHVTFCDSCISMQLSAVRHGHRDSSRFAPRHVADSTPG